MGKLLSALPTDVHLGKFLLLATLFRCLDPALTIAATLNSKSPFLTPFGHEDEADRAKASFKIGTNSAQFGMLLCADRQYRELRFLDSSQCFLELAPRFRKSWLRSQVLPKEFPQSSESATD